MFVAVEPDAVSQAMAEELVVRAVTRRSDYTASSVNHRTGELPLTCGVKSSVVRAANDLKNLLHLRGRLAENPGACDIRIVTFYLCASIDEDDVTPLQFLRLLTAMRKRCGWTDQNKGIASEVHLCESGSHQLADVLLRHAFVQGGKYRTEDVAGGLAR